MLPEKLQKWLSGDEIGLNWFQRLGGRFVRFSRYCARQATHLSRLRDPQDQRFTIRRARRKFYAPVAEDEDAPGLLPLHKKNRSLRIRRRRRNRVQSLQRG